ncbi:SRPBCC family protein [Dyadobacter sp. CY343]|uniref:SRPBCC family protein n=1 Tax=Dyadobacter sp. CY343 TaxID=2907299 RepID=UPI001F21E8DD|nr:SRPBCC family protein [Dyadobacter sp. CY343]MCE7063068.1 SRPBCC family protein [Dyadobacter sp. CY343]
MTKMPIILLETPVKASLEICYKLSLNVDLHKISTSKTGEHIISGVKHGMMKPGDSVTWRAKHFGIWQTLTTKITFAKPYVHFVDEMTQGAFKSMKHEHFFEQTDEGTLMKDVFRFVSPYGMAGRIFNHFVLENYMRKFLAERNHQIKKVAESNLRNRFL